MKSLRLNLSALCPRLLLAACVCALLFFSSTFPAFAASSPKKGEPLKIEQKAETGESFWVAGGLYTFLKTGNDTNGQFSLFDFYVPQKAGPPPHIHSRDDEAFYILEGDLSLQFENQTLVATPGTFIYLPKHHIHEFKNLGTSPVHALSMTVPSGLENLFAEVGQPGTDKSAPPRGNYEDYRQKFKAVAPKYGVEIHPEASLLSGESLSIGPLASPILKGPDGFAVLPPNTGSPSLKEADFMYAYLTTAKDTQASLQIPARKQALNLKGET